LPNTGVIKKSAIFHQYIAISCKKKYKIRRT